MTNAQKERAQGDADAPHESTAAGGRPQFAIGIDLGTTNSVLAYARLDNLLPGAPVKVETLPIPQLVAAATVEALPSLASFAYLPADDERKGKAFALPWDAEPRGVVGELARRQAAEAPRARWRRPKVGWVIAASIAISRFSRRALRPKSKKSRRSKPRAATSRTWSPLGTPQCPTLHWPSSKSCSRRRPRSTPAPGISRAKPPSPPGYPRISCCSRSRKPPCMRGWPNLAIAGAASSSWATCCWCATWAAAPATSRSLAWPRKTANSSCAGWRWAIICCSVATTWTWRWRTTRPRHSRPRAFRSTPGNRWRSGIRAARPRNRCSPPTDRSAIRSRCSAAAAS